MPSPFNHNTKQLLERKYQNFKKIVRLLFFFFFFFSYAYGLFKMLGYDVSFIQRLHHKGVLLRKLDKKGRGVTRKFLEN